MKHENYINTLKNLAPKYKVGVSETRLQATENLPDSFAELLEPLLKIITDQKAIFLKETGENASLVIGDIQFAGACIISDSQEEPCFTLLYYVKDGAKLNKNALIVNFTTGEIMNDEQYYNLLGYSDGDESASLITYGRLPIEKLINAWSKCEDKKFIARFKSPTTHLLVNDSLAGYGIRFFDSNDDVERGRDPICISPSRG